MATVKGDVHDIGKNIVGVVLGCNNYDVIDLGVMVPAAKILDTAIAEGADAVGLSGLITPSLDQMVSVAEEMQRRGLHLPLLIGGATTSRQHTAVRIAPAYDNPTVHVLDASRVVGVVSDLLDPVRAAELDKVNRADQERLRVEHASKQRRPLLPLWQAQANREQVSFDDLAVPSFTGTTLVTPDLRRLRELIDWQFFFLAWELKGKYPAILEQPAARELFDDANALLDEIIDGELLTARGVYGFWPASADGDDIVVPGGTGDDAAARGGGADWPATRFPMLRQQMARTDTRPNRCLADYVAPTAGGAAREASATTSARSLSASPAPRIWRASTRRRTTTTARSPSRRSPTGSPRRAPSTCTWKRGGPGTSQSRSRRSRSCTPSGSAASGRRSAIPRARTTPRSRSSSTCWTRADRGRADRVVRDDAGRERQRAAARASGRAVLRGRPDRQGPGRGLRGAQGCHGRGSRVLAAAEPVVRADQVSRSAGS